MSIIKTSPAKHVKSSEDDYLKGGYGDKVQWRLDKKNCDSIYIFISSYLFSESHNKLIYSYSIFSPKKSSLLNQVDYLNPDR